MKRYLPFSILLLLTPFTPLSQTYNIDFETDPSDFIIYRDTISNPNCIWQIGQPNKNTFTSAYSGNNVIVTDTVNSYPINDTSAFIIKYKVGGGLLNATSWNSIAYISGRYKVNTDTLSDYCKIEFSPNNGIDWVLISDDTTSYIDGSIQYWPSQINDLVLTGNIDNWNTFEIYVDYGSSYLFNITETDTIKYKFTFISDNNSENLDGIMFDNISVIDDGTDFLRENDIFTEIYPNPFNNSLTILPAVETSDILIYNLEGRLIYSQKLQSEKLLEINTSEFVPGIYLVVQKDKNGVIINSEKLVK